MWFIYSVTILVFRISKINHEYPCNSVIYEWAVMHEWIIIVVGLQIICFWYSECKSCYAVNYIYFTLLFWAKKTCKKGACFLLSIVMTLVLWNQAVK